MRAMILLLAASLAVVAAVPRNSRIVGGDVTTIEQYPYGAALLASWGASFSQSCGATVINNRAVLTAAHCFMHLPSASSWRIRVGSNFANSGGVVLNTAAIINHPSFNRITLDNDICIMRSATAITYNSQVSAASIAGANYNLPDNQVVWAIGWGALWYEGPGSEQLRHVQIWTVNQNTCRTRYAELRYTITDNMLCSGWLDVGGRDQCQGDSGGPLIHNNAVVAICSWGEQCALPRYPGVGTRVSRYTSWIQSNA